MPNQRQAILKWVKRSFLVAVVGGLVAAAAMAMRPKPVPVDIAEATVGPMRVTIDEDARTRVKHRYVVTAPLTGSMPRVAAKEGDPIATGEALTTIVPMAAPLLDKRSRAEAQARLAAASAGERQAAAHVRRARTALEQAQLEVEREGKLYARGISSKALLDQAEFAERAREQELSAAAFAMKVATENVAAGKAALGLVEADPNGQQLIVASPISGRVLRVLRRDEGLVTAGTPVMELGDPATLEIISDVLTRDAVHIKSGAEVAIVRWGGERRLSGRVLRVEPAGFTRMSALGVEEQRVNVIIDIDDIPSDVALGDAYRVEVEITIWEGSEVLSVPASAVFRAGDGWAVYAVAGGLALLAPVQIGQRNDERMEILGGLSTGDRVVVNPSDKIANHVEIVERAATFQ